MKGCRGSRNLCYSKAARIFQKMMRAMIPTVLTTVKKAVIAAVLDRLPTRKFSCIIWFYWVGLQSFFSCAPIMSLELISLSPLSMKRHCAPSEKGTKEAKEGSGRGRGEIKRSSHRSRLEIIR